MVMSRMDDRSMRSRAGGFEEGLAVFVASVISVCVVLVLLPYMQVLLVLLTLVPSLLLAVWIARNEITLKEPNPEAVMVCPGYDAEEKAKTFGFSMVVAAILNYLVAALVTEVESGSVSVAGWGSILSPVFHVFTVLFLIVATFTVLKARSYAQDLKSFMTNYALPTACPTLQMTRNGQVVLGQEFQHVAQLSVSSPTDSFHPLPGEVKTRTVRQWVGKDGPFILDLENQRNPHLVIFGSSGTGKSQTVKSVELRYWAAKRIPFLIIDWQGEQASFVRKIGGMVWTVPKDFKLNPLRLAGSTPSQQVANIEESLTVSLELSPLQAFEVGRIVAEAYKERGIVEDNHETWVLPPPTWKDIIETMQARLRSGQYAGEQIESVNWTIRKLQRASHIFGDELQEFFDVVLNIPTCIDLSELMGVDIAKTLVTYTILQRIYNQFSIRGFSDLRLLLVLDESHQVFGKQAGTAGTQESLPLKIIRLGRKYGFGVVVASQLATDIPGPAISNVATVIAMMHDEPEQVNYVKKFVNLTKTEREIYARLPRGAAFIKHLGEPYPHLVKVNMVADDEIQAVRASTERLRNDVLSRASPCLGTDATSINSKLPPSSPLHLQENFPTHKPTAQETRTLEAKTSAARPSTFEPSIQGSDGDDLTSLEKAVLRILETKPITVRDLLSNFPNIDYRQMLDILEDLHKDGLIQEEKVANLNGKGTVFYAALRTEWVQSESLEHRAMVTIIAEALSHLGPVLYMQTKSDAPDIGLEFADPKVATEVETGRKKLTPIELDRWAEGVKRRNEKLGYRDVLVIVPNAAVEKRYRGVCVKYGLELATMRRLGEKLC